METELYMSAAGGDAEALGRLLQSVASPCCLITGQNGDREEAYSSCAEMCLARDSQGRNPLHLAAIKGEVKLLEELLFVAPSAVRQKVGRGLTVLHLCVEHGQLEALKALMEEVKELVNAKNDDGDTILHMAVTGKNLEVMEYLLENGSVDINSKNSDGQTAKCLFEQLLPEAKYPGINKLGRFKSRAKFTLPVGLVDKKWESMMVAAVLIATVAFQAEVSPPGGVWQEDFTHHDNGTLAAMPHRAGEAVMAYEHETAFKIFMTTNTSAFILSILTILMLIIIGMPVSRGLYIWLWFMVILITAVSTVVTYYISIFVVCPAKCWMRQSESIENALTIAWYASLLMICACVIYMAWKKRSAVMRRNEEEESREQEAIA
ncbi:ankyrin repeat-containing protein ITN1-like [Salvia divinorum]|uniref:Ankyrin repeat-containing protein ITN1-like n=1 Tax=Salvia divinorum TaxID=28513 RepID=A0ABD1FNE6_SALDI